MSPTPTQHPAGSARRSLPHPAQTGDNPGVTKAHRERYLEGHRKNPLIASATGFTDGTPVVIDLSI